MTLWAIANQGCSQNDHTNLDRILETLTALQGQLWIFHSEGDLRRVLWHVALASRARYAAVARASMGGQRLIPALMLPSFSFGHEGVRPSPGCFKEPERVWMCSERSLQNDTIDGNHRQGSWAQAGDESNTSKTKMYVFIRNPLRLSQKLCQLQTETALLSFAFDNQSWFAYIRQNRFQRRPQSS